MSVLTLLLYFVSLFTFYISSYTRPAPKYYGPKSDHFDGENFFNPNVKRNLAYKDVKKWRKERTPGEWPKWVDVKQDLNPLPYFNKGIKVTFIGHSTVLIQMDSLNILTDPIFEKRCSPVSFAGPKRIKNPGIPWKKLPKIHMILVSHNHYDHLDISTIKKICKRDNPAIFCPLGVQKFFEKRGVYSSHDMDWWDEETPVKNVKLTFTQAQHFSGRGLYDRNRTLWGGFMLQTPTAVVFYPGDIGYGDFFKTIAQKFPVIDFALLPIGAYKPNWFMHTMHISPMEAVKIHKELNIKKTMPIHFGSFQMSDEAYTDPLTDFKQAITDNKLDTSGFVILNEGASTVINPKK